LVQEAQQDLAATTRAPAPMAELFALQDEFATRLAIDPDATQVSIYTDP
jgi:hypothetical protein